MYLRKLDFWEQKFGPCPTTHAMCWPASIDAYRGEPSTIQVTSMASSMASHTSDEKIGTIQYDIPHIVSGW